MTNALIKSLVLLAVLVSACRPATGPSPAPAPAIPVVTKAPVPPPNPKLPPVPEVRGPVKISVIYPKPDQLLATRDSNFIFGSVGDGAAALEINRVPVPVWPNGSFMGWLPVPPDSAPRYELVAVSGREFDRLVLPVKLPPAPPLPVVLPSGDTVRPDSVPVDTVTPVPGNVYAAVGARPPLAPGAAPPPLVVSDTDRVSIARPAPGSGQAYKWFLIPGTIVKVTGYKKASGDEFARIELDSTQEAWLPKSEIATETDTSPPVRKVGTVRIEPHPEWIDIVIPTGSPPAYLAEEYDRGISLLLYGVSGAAVISTMPDPADPYLASVSSTPEPTRVRYSINLNQAPYGYLALWKDGALTFRVRRPPRIADTNSPLRGLTITVDPGHPPAGATGPTSLYEGDAVLVVGMKLRDLLVARGVNVVMTRTTPDPVELGLRPIISRRANAHAFVSIHLNAFPDGVNPFVNNGSSTYYFWPHSRLLGQSAQAELLEELGLRDIGTRFGNFAVIRGTWMPSILTEGAFIIMPDQEAAMRVSTYQDAYANAILQGLESYFASLVPVQ